MHGGQLDARLFGRGRSWRAAGLLQKQEESRSCTSCWSTAPWETSSGHLGCCFGCGLLDGGKQWELQSGIPKSTCTVVHMGVWKEKSMPYTYTENKLFNGTTENSVFHLGGKLKLYLNEVLHKETFNISFPPGNISS